MSTTQTTIDIADNEGGDNNKKKGSWFSGFVFVRWSLAFRTSLFLVFEVVDNTDGDFDIADNKDGDDAKKNPSTIEMTPAKGWKTTETT